ncbi:hypothetical protein BDZ89DRAFT_963692 [Hymenopellis radicata]|nr:hypothetical protein BDZ89DRAFT_963692 [Hymenopellis radicata]
MRTCKFGNSYIPPGQTRTETKQTIHITGAYSIQCCPYPEVDDELEYICKMAKQYIKNVRNPFASASWVHLILARCHPFNDGNGRTTRLIASLPLLLHGYPPISITLKQRMQYYEAINEAFDGNHGPLIDCILAGMRNTLKQVQEL